MLRPLVLLALVSPASFGACAPAYGKPATDPREPAMTAGVETTATSLPDAATSLPDARGGRAEKVPFRVVGDRDDLDFEITSGKELIASCRHSCTVDVPRGRYSVRTLEVPGTVGGVRRIDIGGPTTADLRSGSAARRSLGRTSTIAGSVLLGGFVVAMTAMLFVYGDVGGRTPSRTTELVIEYSMASALILGTAGVAVGIPLWAGSGPKLRKRAPGSEELPIAPAVARLSVAALPTPGGVAFGARFVF